MHDDHFTPKHVDEQIEQLAQSLFTDTQEADRNTRLIQLLQQHYATENQKNALERAWEQIEQRYEAPTLRSLPNEHTPYSNLQKPERSGPYLMRKRTGVVSSRRAPIPRWGILVAVIVAALAIGSLTIFITHATTHTGSLA